MSAPQVTMRQLLEAGVHFGHHTGRWNPKMRSFIFGVRNNVHILDLQQTVPLLDHALKILRDTAAQGGRVLFVGTKRSAQEKIKQAAQKCGQYYVNERWLGGMMTNWQTVMNSISRLKYLEQALAEESTGLTKKELLNMSRERDKLESAIGGIKDMAGLPDVLFIIDTNKEQIAVKEANKLGIPIVAVIDSNSDPYGIDYPIPGNDDAMRAIDLYCELVAAAVLDGIQAELARSGQDQGAQENPAVELPSEEEVQAEMESQSPDKQGSAESASAETAPETAESPETEKAVSNG